MECGIIVTIIDHLPKTEMIGMCSGLSVRCSDSVKRRCSMKELLKNLCDKYLLNLGLFTDFYPLERDILYPVCANVFCAADAVFDLGKFKDSMELIKDNPKVLSSFRSTVRPLIASLLSVSGDPRGEMEKYFGCYELLRKYFTNSEHLALLSLLLVRIAPAESAEDYIKRGRQIYDRMKKEHRILTTKEDVAFAVMLAFSEKTDDELIEDMEACYKLLKKRADNNSIQTVSHVLAMANGDPEDKCAKFGELYDSMIKKGRKYGKHYELAMLAALSITKFSSAEILDDISDSENFLSQHRSVGDLSEFGKEEPMSHTFLLLTIAYAGDENVSSESERHALLAARQATLYSVLVYSMMTVAPLVPE